MVDFLPPLMEISEQMYMKNPGDAFSTVSYIGAFTKVSWMEIGLWMIFMSLILLCFLRSSMNRNQEGLGLFDYHFGSSSVYDYTYKLTL